MEDGLKISELTTTTTINDSDLIPIVQNNETKSVTKEDMLSDTKALIDRNSTYTTTEKIIGTWYNGKPIYRKVVDFGALPNATIKRVAHNVQNIDFATNLYAVSKRVQSGVTTWAFIPYVRTTALEQMGMWLEDGNIAIQTGIDRSSFTLTYVILEYTKTTD